MEISKHAQERYAERIMDKTDTLSVNTYISLHTEDISEAIHKMIEYGELIYSGISISEYNKNVVDVYLKDTWIIIVDKARQKVVTLYSIDLGVGKEFNQQYMELLLGRLHKAQERFTEKKTEIDNQQEEYRQIIAENKAVIDDYKKTIKSLEEQNQMFESLIESLSVNRDLAEKDVRDTVAILVGRKVF